MDKEIRHRGHTNVIVFAYAALQAFFQVQLIEEDKGEQPPGVDTQKNVKKESQQEISADSSAPASGGVKTLKGKVMKVLKEIQEQVWWLRYAKRILRIVMKDRAETRSVGLEEEKAAIEDIIKAEQKLPSLDEKVRLKKAVRLAVERTLEERVSNKKITVSRRVSAKTLQ